MMRCEVGRCKVMPCHDMQCTAIPGSGSHSKRVRCAFLSISLLGGRREEGRKVCRRMVSAGVGRCLGGWLPGLEGMGKWALVIKQ
jgi:hypothetical protein